MFGVEEKIKALGVRLADGFSARARFYVEQSKSGAVPKERAVIIATVLAEVGSVIMSVTKGEE